MFNFLFFILTYSLVVPFLLGAQDVDDNVLRLVHSNNTFALKLFHAIGKDQKNLCFSPYSISSALAMTYAGAQGETKNEMGSVLGFSKLEETVHPSFSWLNQYLATSSSDESNDLRIFLANSLWIQEGQHLLPKFMDVMTTYYKSSIQRVDFIQQADQSRVAINNWVKKKTVGKIENLINPNDLTRSTRLVLVSAIYLKARWADVFDKKATKQESFFITPKDTVSIPMMTNTGAFGYFGEGQHFALLELPYVFPKASNDKAPEFSMLILLPRENFGINNLEKLITVDSLQKWISALKSERVSVFLPRFRILERFNLNEALEKLGMPIAFSNKADFSGMTGNQELKIGKVLHKAFISVDEDGTEAAAATAVSMGLTAVREEKKTVLFRVDHPFIYIIYEKKTGTILFLGRILNPSTEQ